VLFSLLNAIVHLGFCADLICGDFFWLVVCLLQFFLVAEYIQQREEGKKNNERVGTKPQQTLYSRCDFPNTCKKVVLSLEHC